MVVQRVIIRLPRCCSVAKLCPTVQPHGLQHSRFLCPPLSPRVCSNSCLLNHWCYLTIPSSAVPFSCLPSFPASGSFPVGRLFASGGQNIGASASASVLPMNIQSWFPLGLTALILQSKGLSRVFSNTTVQSIISWCWGTYVYLWLIHVDIWQKPTQYYKKLFFN